MDNENGQVRKSFDDTTFESVLMDGIEKVQSSRNQTVEDFYRG